VIAGFHQVFAKQEYVYYVYVDPIPYYATSYASDAIPNAISTWEHANPQIKFYLTNNTRQANFEIQWIKDYGDVRYTVGEYVIGSPLIQVGLGDSRCMNQWEPYSSSTVTHIAEHEIGHWLGLPHTQNQNNIMYPFSIIQYGAFSQSRAVDTGGWTFFSTCNSEKSITYDYSIDTDNLAVSFNAYFAPSGAEIQASMGQPFSYYTEVGCSAKNVNAFNGVCIVPVNSILLVNPLESHFASSVTVYVDMQEKVSYPKSIIPVLPHGAIPEFSSLAGMIITISIFGVIIISRNKSKFSV